MRNENEIMEQWGTSSSTTVSIICITYNHEKFIAKAIDSFLNQVTTFPFEIILHDDASTDSTAQIIYEYQKKYPKIIKTILQKENQYKKKVKITLSVLPNAKGKYLALCEGDDYWLTNDKLEKQVRFLENNPNYYLTVSNALVDNDGVVINREWRWDKKRVDFDVRDYIINLFFHTSTICCRNRQIIWDKFDFSNVLQGDQLFVLFHSTPNCNKIKFFEEPMSVYRIHEGGVTATNINKNLKRSVNSLIEILEKFDIYSDRHYHDIITYRVKELQTLFFIKDEKKIFKKLSIVIKNSNIVINYLLRKLFGKKPFLHWM